MAHDKDSGGVSAFTCGLDHGRWGTAREISANEKELDCIYFFLGVSHHPVNGSPLLYSIVGGLELISVLCYDQQPIAIPVDA